MWQAENDRYTLWRLEHEMGVKPIDRLLNSVTVSDRVEAPSLTGLGLMPISVFVILLLEQTRYLGVDLIDHLAPLAAATLLLEVIGPVATQQALRWAGEASEEEGRDAA